MHAAYDDARKKLNQRSVLLTIWITFLLLGVAAWAELDWKFLSDAVLKTHGERLSRRQFFSNSTSTNHPQHTWQELAQSVGTPGAAWNGSEKDEQSPKIFVYPLPSRFQSCNDPGYGMHNYGAEQRVPDAIMKSRHITRNPELADFFYVPVQLYCLHGRPLPELGIERADHYNLATATLAYIRDKYTFWDRRQGADHIWLFTQDHGFCGFANNEGGVPVLANSIILSHWGLQTPEIDCNWWTRLHNYGHCIERQASQFLDEPRFAMPCFVPGKDVVVAHPAADYLRFVPAADAGLPSPAVRQVLTKPVVKSNAIIGLNIFTQDDPSEQLLNFSFPLLVPAQVHIYVVKNNDEREAMQDLLFQLKEVLTETNATKVHQDETIGQIFQLWEDLFGVNLTESLESPSKKSMISAKKETVLFFNGDNRYNDPGYSHGVRQTVAALFHNTSGFRILDKHTEGASFEEVLLEMGRSTFCLAATGAGWGVRLKLAVMMGCIPVVIAPDVQMEFEEVLPYKDFAVRIPQHAIYLLPSILDILMKEPGRVAAMQQRLACVWMYLSWHREHGRALDALICTLRRRLYGATNIWPIMDWDTCQMTCRGPEFVDTSKLDPEERTRQALGGGAT